MIKLAGDQAIALKRGKNINAAKKKMVERAKVVSQLDKIQNSIAMIDMHRCVCVCVCVLYCLAWLSHSFYSLSIMF